MTSGRGPNFADTKPPCLKTFRPSTPLRFTQGVSCRAGLPTSPFCVLVGFLAPAPLPSPPPGPVGGRDCAGGGVPPQLRPGPDNPVGEWPPPGSEPGEGRAPPRLFPPAGELGCQCTYWEMWRPLVGAAFQQTMLLLCLASSAGDVCILFIFQFVLFAYNFFLQYSETDICMHTHTHMCIVYTYTVCSMQFIHAYCGYMYHFFYCSIYANNAHMNTHVHYIYIYSMQYTCIWRIHDHFFLLQYIRKQCTYTRTCILYINSIGIYIAYKQYPVQNFSYVYCVRFFFGIDVPSYI